MEATTDLVHVKGLSSNEVNRSHHKRRGVPGEPPELSATEHSMLSLAIWNLLNTGSGPRKRHPDMEYPGLLCGCLVFAYLHRLGTRHPGNSIEQVELASWARVRGTRPGHPALVPPYHRGYSSLLCPTPTQLALWVQEKALAHKNFFEPFICRLLKIQRPLVFHSTIYMLFKTVGFR